MSYALRDIKSGRLIEYPGPLLAGLPRTFGTRKAAESYAAPNVTHDGKPTMEVVEFAAVSPEVREMGRGNG